MHDAQLALVPMPATATATAAVGEPRPVRRSLALYGIGTACFAAIGLLPPVLPVVSIGAIVTCAILTYLFSMGGARRDGAAARALEPESIASHELRETYRSVLFARAELERAIAGAPRLHAPVARVLERCRSAVTACERMAQLAEPLQRYLDAHDPAHIRWELDRLRARAEVTSDEAAVAALSHATAARARQLASHDEIAGQRDRVHARLELVRAALESFTATIVKLQGADEEQIVLAGESVSEHLDEVGDELAVLESALETDLAA